MAMSHPAKAEILNTGALGWELSSGFSGSGRMEQRGIITIGTKVRLNWNKGEVAISILLAFTQLDSETSNAGEGFGDIGLCVFLGDESGDNEVQMWTEGVFASNRTDFNCICNKSC